MDNGITPAGLLALGIIVGLLSTCVQSFGLTLQRKSHMIEDSKTEYEERRAPYQRRRWQVGMFLFLLANIVGSSVQITTLPLPLLSTLQASGLVFNSIMASLILKEKWTWQTVIGTVLVAGGAVLISLFSALPEPSHNLEQLTALFWQTSFLIWFSLSLVFVLCTLIADYSMRKLISIEKAESPRTCLIRGMGYGMLSGILSAHSLLLAKSAVELIVRSVADKVNQFNSYKSALLIIAFLVLALTQLYYLHLGLRLVSTSILYPFVFCIYNIVAILDGLIYFRQMDVLPPLHAGMIGLGTFILLVGVLALSWRLQDEPDTPEHPPIAKVEVPQTLLAPGMGFVAEPDSESESAPTQDSDADEATDIEPLIVQRSRSKSVKSHRRVSTETHASRRRRRAATLKEVIAIWEELGDDEAERKYGTFHEALASASARPASSGEAIQEDGEHALAESADDLRRHVQYDQVERAPLRRSKTTPSPGSRPRRRSTGHRPQGALFSDLLKVQWWKPRRKPDEQDHDNT